MPGKTKHFQTLILNEKVTLCDCPGLVFPRISASIAYMVLNGLFSIDTLKSYHDPMKILTQRIGQDQIENLYGIHWKEDEAYEWESILIKYSQLKGFFTGSGLPNLSLAARNILKDYINGNLAYARNPPNLLGEEMEPQMKKQVRDKELEEQIKKKQNKKEKELDENFFQSKL